MTITVYENLTEGEKDRCVVCGRETKYSRKTPIDQRAHYIEGAGQLCSACYAEIYQCERAVDEKRQR